MTDQANEGIDSPLQDVSAQERDLIIGLGSDGDKPAETEKPLETAKEETPKEETPAAQTPATADDAPKEETAAAPPTEERYEKVSKALQKVQMELADLKRRNEAQGGLTDKQQARAEKLQEQAVEIEDELGDILKLPDQEFAQTDGVKKVVKRVQSHDQRLEKLEQENAQLKERLTLGEDARQKESLQQFWASEQKTYEGINVQDVWANSLKEVEKRPALVQASKLLESKRLTPAEYEQMLREEATQVYTDRVKAAKASVDAKKTAAKEPPKTSTAHRAPPTTPGGASVTQSQGGPQAPTALSADEVQLEMVKKYLAF